MQKTKSNNCFIMYSKSSAKGIGEFVQILIENTFKLFRFLAAFSDSKVEISSVFNDANRLKAILFTL